MRTDEKSILLLHSVVYRTADVIIICYIKRFETYLQSHVPGVHIICAYNMYSYLLLVTHDNVKWPYARTHVSMSIFCVKNKMPVVKTYTVWLIPVLYTYTVYLYIIQ